MLLAGWPRGARSRVHPEAQTDAAAARQTHHIRFRAVEPGDVDVAFVEVQVEPEPRVTPNALVKGSRRAAHKASGGRRERPLLVEVLAAVPFLVPVELARKLAPKSLQSRAAAQAG